MLNRIIEISPADRYRTAPASLSQAPNPDFQGMQTDQLLQSQNGRKNRLLTFISIEDNCLHFHDEAAYVLNRYQSNNISFIGIWGSDASDKISLYDQILKLCGVQEQDSEFEHDCRIFESAQNEKQQSQNCIMFFQRPIRKGNQKIFLLAGWGYQISNSLCRAERLELDILMSICSLIILTPPAHSEPNAGTLSGEFAHLNASFSRLYNGPKQASSDLQETQSVTGSDYEVCWPKSLVALYSSSSCIRNLSNKSDKDAQNMFSDCVTAILPDFSFRKKGYRFDAASKRSAQNKCLNDTRNIFAQIYSKVEPKAYQLMKFNGITVPHIIFQLTHAFNNHNSVFIPKVMHRAKRSVFNHICSQHEAAYLVKLNERYVSEEKPYDTEYLLNAFQEVQDQTLRDYDNSYSYVMVVKNSNRYGKGDKDYLAYGKKLQNFINQKQKNILNVNTKKSMQELNGSKRVTLSNLEARRVGGEQFHRFSQNQKMISHEYDSNAHCEVVASALKQYYQEKAVLGHEKKRSNSSASKFNLEYQSKKLSLSHRRKYLEDLSAQQELQEKKRKIKEYESLQNDLKQEIDRIAGKIKLHQEKVGKSSKLSKLSQGSQGGPEQLKKLLAAKKRQYSELKDMARLQQLQKQQVTKEIQDNISEFGGADSDLLKPLKRSKLLQSQLKMKQLEVEKLQKTARESIIRNGQQIRKVHKVQKVAQVRSTKSSNIKSSRRI